jgi:hypothetical protein
MLLGANWGTATLMPHPYIPTTMNISEMRQLRTCDGRTARLCNWYYELCKTSEENCKNGFVPTLNY